MPNNITMYNLLVSCPGDVKEAVDRIDEVIESFNQRYNDTLGIGICKKYWKTSAYAQSGGKPQELLNKQFVEKCDLAVAIFKTRFGTPTDEYGSGSEEEIEIMLKSGKDVLLYFDNSPVSLSGVDLEQYNKVRDFQERYKDKGLYWTYNSLDEFQKLLSSHIDKTFLTMERVNEIQESIRSNLCIKSYYANKIYDSAIVSSFDMGGYIDVKQLCERMIHLFKAIPLHHVQAGDYYSLVEKKVEVDDGTKAWIVSASEMLGIELDKHFFDLGGLSENVLSSAVLYGSRNLQGSMDEKEKYKEILQLEETVKKYAGQCEVEELYSKLKGIKFLLCNTGTKYDEDIDIEIRMPKDMFLDYLNLNVPKQPVCTEEEWNFSDIFTIARNRDYMDYDSSKRNLGSIAQNTNFTDFWDRKSYKEQYEEEIDETFIYEVYDTADATIVRLHVDYLKQYQNVAFPTWIFVNDMDTYPEIEYSITSKYCSSRMEGMLQVEKMI